MKRFISMAVLMLCGSAALAQYTNRLEDGTVQIVSNVWSAGTVWVGGTSSTNQLFVVAGGDITSTNVYIGSTNTAYGNLISMSQTSRWDIADALVFGEGQGNEVSVTDGAVLSADRIVLSSGNTLTLDSGGAISHLTSLGVYSHSAITGAGTIGFNTNNASLAFYGAGITCGTGIVFSAYSNADNTLSYYDREFNASQFNAAQFENFNQLVLSNSDLTGTGTLDFTKVSMTGGTISPAGDEIGSISIAGSFSSTNTLYQAQIAGASQDELVVSGGGPLNLAGLKLEVQVSGTTTGAVSILTASGGFSGYFASEKITGRPLLYTVELQITNNAVQVVLAPDDALEISSALGFAAAESVRGGFGNMKNLVFTRTKQLRRNLVATDHAVPNDVYLMTTTNAPAGAMGPGDQNTIFDMHVWMQHYNGQGSFERTGASDGFTQNNSGTVIGADKLIGDNLAVGLNYTYGRSSSRAGNGDALDTESYWIGAYGEWVGVDGLYIDALAAYGTTSFDSQRFAESYHGTASYKGNAFGAYVDVGQYYSYADSMTLSPYMGIHALAMVNAAHNETEDEGSVVRVDEVDHNWLESALGLKVRHRFDTGIGRFQTTGYAEWTYDFIQDDVYSSLSSDGLSGAETMRVSPDESGINVGLGYSWICTDYMEIGVGYGGRFSAYREEHTGSLMFDIMF